MIGEPDELRTCIMDHTYTALGLAGEGPATFPIREGTLAFNKMNTNKEDIFKRSESTKRTPPTGKSVPSETLLPRVKSMVVMTPAIRSPVAKSPKSGVVTRAGSGCVAGETTTAMVAAPAATAAETTR